MKTKSPIFRRLWLLVLLAVMPMCIKAKMVEKPFLCIEKTNGEVVKVPITDEYPTIRYTFTIQDSGTERQFVHYLQILLADNEDIWIPRDEIKCLSTKFELVDTSVLGIKSDDDSTSDVYSMSGIRVGSFAYMSSLPKGIYLVKKGSLTLKFVNK